VTIRDGRGTIQGQYYQYLGCRDSWWDSLTLHGDTGPDRLTRRQRLTRWARRMWRRP
jgi:hypothetical protein